MAFKPGEGGRPRGVRNKATRDVQAMCRRLVEDKAYRKQFKARLLAKELSPPLEAMIWHYAYGKPKETTVVENPDGSALAFTLQILTNGDRA